MGGNMETKKNNESKYIDVAQVMPLAKVGEYQKGSVVSKNIINKKSGTVTFFAFDKNEGLSEHSAPFDAIVYIIEGEADIIISEKTYLLKKGEMIIMPANKPHAIKAEEQFKMLLTMIK